MEKMREIIDQLNTWAHAYYTLDAPLVDDKTYDALYDKLVAMEKETGKWRRIRLPVASAAIS